MSISWNEMQDGIEDARGTIRRFQLCINRIAFLLKGNLQAGEVGHSALCELKIELRKYNMNTGEWKP